MSSMIAYGEFDAVLASRILEVGALKTAVQFRLSRMGLVKARIFGEGIER
jgi:hypothetical protein